MIVDVQLLGVPRITLEHQEVRLPSRKALGLLAYLAFEGVTPREQLAALLWSDLETRRARHNLRQELYLIGRTPLGRVLDVGAAHVTLRGPVDVDALTVAGLAAAGHVDDALALMRGPLLDGYILDDAELFGEWLTVKRERFDALRRELMVRQAGLLEHQGDARGALRVYLDLLAEDPLQETHERAAIRLHTLLGERERALQRFEHFRALLVRDLGLEPLPETVLEVERARVDVPSPPAAAPLPVGPPLTAPFIGRGEAWRSLERSEAALTLLTGEPGAGKTRLALAFAATFGPPVVLRGHEVSEGTPLSPVAEAIRAALYEPPRRARLEALAPALRAEISRLVPDVPAPPAHVPEGRARFVEALVRALLAITGPGGALVWDDVQWMDASSLEVLTHLVRRTAQLDAPPRVLATARRDEAALRDDLQSVLQALRRDQLVEPLSLEGLRLEEVDRLVQTLSNSTAPSLLSERLYTATGGNPLFVLETLRSLFDTGRLTADGGAWTSPISDDHLGNAEFPVPPEVRDVLAARVRRLSAAAQRLLEAASVCGDVFDLHDLAACVALTEWEALEPLESLLAAQLLTEHGEHFRFSHDLIRRTVHDGLSGQRRRLLHHRVAQQLEGRGADPARIADHFEDAGDTRSARAWRVRAAQEATRVYAYHEALRQYARALDLNPEPELAYAWSLARVDVMRILDDRAGSHAELERLSRLAAQIGDPAKRAEVAIRWSLVHDQAGEYVLAMQQAALAAAEPHLGPELRAQALHAVGTAWVRQLDYATAEPLFLEGLAQDPLPPALRARLLDSLAHCALQRNDDRQAAAYNAQARANWLSAADRRGLAVSHNTAARLAMLGGDLPGAVDHMQRAMQEARLVGDFNLTKSFIANLVQVLCADGQLDAAVDAVSEGLDLVHESGDRSGEGRLQHRLGDVQLLRGRLGAALAAYRQAHLIAVELEQHNHQVHTVMDQVSTLLLIGHTGTVPALLGELERLVASTSANLSGADLDLQRARYAWLTGDPAGAEQRLNALWDARDALGARLRERLAVLLARVRCARGDQVSPLALTAGVASTPALRATALMLACRCGPEPSAVEEAEGLVASGRIDPVTALELRQALAHHLRSAHPERAEQHARAARALLDQLCATLPVELQGEFLQWYAPPEASDVSAIRSG